MAKNNNSINFDKVIKKLSGDAKASNKPWFKKKASIIAMSSTLGAGVLATVIAVPVALTSGSSTSNETKPPIVDPSVAIAAFNNKPTSEKIDLYNSIMANSANNTAINNYFLKSNCIGMLNFINTNVTNPTDSVALALFNSFKGALNTNLFNNVSVGNFLNIKGIESTTSNITNNNNITSRYFLHSITINDKGLALSFLSPTKKSITNVTMRNDFSIEMTLPNSQSNIAFIIKDEQATDRLTYYNSKIIFNDSTLFPGMSEFVKTSILNLTKQS